MKLNKAKKVLNTMIHLQQMHLLLFFSIHKNKQNKPFLTIYTSEQIMEYISPPLVMPQPVYILNLIDPNRIDLSSPIIKCGCLKMITDEIIDKSSISVENGYVKVGKDGRIDRRCDAYRDALKRYIRKKKREQKAKRIQKQKSQHRDTLFDCQQRWNN